MCFPSQCIVHFCLKLHYMNLSFSSRLLAEKNNYTCIFRYVTQPQDVRPDGIALINISWAKTLKISWEKRPSACHACSVATISGANNCWVVGNWLVKPPRCQWLAGQELQGTQRFEAVEPRKHQSLWWHLPAALYNNTKLDYLNLQNTSVFGDLAALQRATKLKDSSNFEVSNTNITCPQEALQAVLIKLGFQEQQLQDLYAMEGLTWMLSSRSSLTFYSLAAHGLTNNFFGKAVEKLWETVELPSSHTPEFFGG